MPRRLVPLAVPDGPACLDILPALRAALDGSGPAVAPYAAGAGAPRLPPYDERDLPDDLAVVVGTSGTTGAPKLALLGSAALAASAAATAERLGGVGDWLLALPAQHVAGLQVLLRASAWGTGVTVPPAGPFRADTFADAVEEWLGQGPAPAGPAPAGRRYVSLVPTQLGRHIEDASGPAALSRFAAVLVGGAACSPALLARARAAGIRVVTTYGSSETCGGCVYDGVPLSCADVAVEAADETGIGRILLGGTMLAAGYLGDPDRSAAAFPTHTGRRVFRTDDLGRLDAAAPASGPCQAVPDTSRAPGLLSVLGRADDVIVTGGYKVLPRVVEDAVRAAAPGWDALVTGVRDEQWGEIVAVALSPIEPARRPDRPAATAGLRHDSPVLPEAPGLRRDVQVLPEAPSLTQLQTALRAAPPPYDLPSYALPRRLLVLRELPLLGIGKTDRGALRAAFTAPP